MRELELERALEAIIKTTNQARTQTTRLRYIRGLANCAIHGKSKKSLKRPTNRYKNGELKKFGPDNEQEYNANSDS